jgi:hypothetical protein
MISNVVYKRSWRELFLDGRRICTKKEKEPKRKKGSEGEACGNCAAMEIDKGGLRRLHVDDFHRCLKKSTHKTLRLFHSSHRLDGGYQQQTIFIYFSEAAIHLKQAVSWS